jgi:flagellar assembly factor FliW
MEIQTTRFGRLSIDNDSLITFPRGLLGFPNYTQYALIEAADGAEFFWLQAVDEPQLAFIVTDPSLFFKDYDVPLREENQTELHITDATQGRVLVICNRVGEWLTGNLLGPIVINDQNRLAQQIVLTEKKWTTRQPLIRLGTEMRLAKSA